MADKVPYVFKKLEQYDVDIPDFEVTQIGNFSRYKDVLLLNKPCSLRNLKASLEDVVIDAHTWKDVYQVSPGLDDDLKMILNFIAQNFDCFKFGEDSDDYFSNMYRVKSTIQIEPNFIMCRGAFASILSAPYSGVYNVFVVTKVKNCLIVDSNSPSRVYRHRVNECSWKPEAEVLHKVTSHRFTPGDSLQARQTKAAAPCNPDKDFNVIVQNKWQKKTIILNAKIHARDPAVPINPNNPLQQYVELKTCMDNVLDIPQKIPFWWAQAACVGLPRLNIYSKYISDKGKLELFEALKTEEIPEKNDFKRNICMQFCDDFLEFIKKTTVEPYPKFYKFELKFPSIISVKETDQHLIDPIKLRAFLGKCRVP